MTLLSFPSCASGPDNWRQHNTAYTAQQQVDPWPLNWSRAWSIASTRNHAYRRTSQTRLRGVSMSSMSGNQRKKLGGNRGRQRHERISPWCWQATFTQWSAVSKTPKKVNLKNDSHAKARNKKGAHARDNIALGKIWSLQAVMGSERSITITLLTSVCLDVMDGQRRHWGMHGYMGRWLNRWNTVCTWVFVWLWLEH